MENTRLGHDCSALAQFIAGKQYDRAAIGKSVRSVIPKELARAEQILKERAAEINELTDTNLLEFYMEIDEVVSQLYQQLGDPI